MAQLYDEEGNLIEGALTPDEVQALHDEKEALAQEAASVKERLSKLEAKDMNFRRLEQMTEDEKAKLSAQEMEIIKRQEALESEQRDFRNRQIDSYKNAAISALPIGDDAEMREKITKNYDRIKDEAVTPEEIARKMYEAYSMTIGTQNIANPLNVAMGFSGGQPPKSTSSKGFADSDEGKALAASLGMSIAKSN